MSQTITLLNSHNDIVFMNKGKEGEAQSDYIDLLIMYHEVVVES